MVSYAAMLPVTLEHITKRFDKTLAVDDVSLRIEPGELFFLLGPSRRRGAQPRAGAEARPAIESVIHPPTLIGAGA